MIVTLDKSGRMVVPKPVRERLGAAFEMVESPEGILLRPLEEEPVMKKINGFRAHQGKAHPRADWTRAVEDTREERILHLT